MSDKSERLFKIYSRLKRGPLTVDMMKAWAAKNDIAVSERTFYRDLKDLETSLLTDDERLVVTEGEKNKKTWKIEFSKSRNSLTEFDINSYLLFRNFLPQSLVDARKESFRKIENLFYFSYSKSRFENFITVAGQQIRGSHFYEVSDLESYSVVLEDMIWCIQNKRELEIKEIVGDYTSISHEVQFPDTLLPLQLLYHRGVVHICGFIKNTEKLVVIAVEQIKCYKVSNMMFDNDELLKILEKEMNKRFGITENMNEKLYRVELEFSENTGNFVRNQHWHTSQKFQKKKNGNIVMKMHCGINRELVGWIFQWMNNVRVNKPAVLNKIMIKKFEDLLKSYKNGAKVSSNNDFRPGLPVDRF